MLEFVNNLKGLQVMGSDYPNITETANQALAAWDKFVAGTYTREQLAADIDLLLSSENIDSLETVDEKFEGYVIEQLTGLKTQDPTAHLPSTVFDVNGNDVTYEPSTTFARSDPLPE